MTLHTTLVFVKTTLADLRTPHRSVYPDPDTDAVVIEEVTEDVAARRALMTAIRQAGYDAIQRRAYDGIRVRVYSAHNPLRVRTREAPVAARLSTQPRQPATAPPR